MQNFKPDAPKRNALQIAKLKHAGDWNIAPQAIPNLMDALRKPPYQFDVVVTQKDLFPRDPNLVYYPLDLYSRPGIPVVRRKILTRCASTSSPAGAPCSLTPRVAAPHSTPPFAGSSPSSSPTTPWSRSLMMIRSTRNGRCRPQGRPVHQGGRRRPRLSSPRGGEAQRTLAVIYSKYDIGCALERHTGIECKGYTYEIAIKIAGNIVIYSTMP